MTWARGRPTAIAIGLALVAAAFAGCATSTTGAAVPAAHPTSETTAPGVRAPKVAHPLDPSAMVAAPCTSLTAANVRDIGFDHPISQSDKDANGTGCAWASEGGGDMNITWETSNKHGLRDLYATQSKFGYWIPTTIGGYPGVYGDVLGDLRGHGDCVVNVGVNDQLVFIFEYDNPLTPARDCPLVATAAADVIANLKGGE
jgi:hypothetical protein